MVELDAYTDPRFVRQEAGRDAIGLIGRVIPAGPNVYVDGRRISGETPLYNRAHVRTGSASGALAVFVPARALPCLLLTTAFNEGRLYAEAPMCVHEVDTASGMTRTEVLNTRYQVNLRRSGTEVTVVQGMIRLSPRDNPQASRVLRRNQQAIMSPARVSEPIELSDDAVRDQLGWRRFGARRAATDDETAEQIGKAIIGVAVPFILNEIGKSQGGRDDDVPRPRPERPSIDDTTPAPVGAGGERPRPIGPVDRVPPQGRAPRVTVPPGSLQPITPDNRVY